MATCNDIVRLAMGRLRQLRSGETPTGQEASDGMLFLQSMYDQWTAAGLFGRLNDVIASGPYTAMEQDRVINDSGYPITLPLAITPSLFSDSSWNWPDQRTWADLATTTTRPPRDLSMIEVIGSRTVYVPAGFTLLTTLSQPRANRYLFDRLKRTWVLIDGLTLTSEAPLSNRGVIGLASCLATLMADEYNAKIAEGTQQAATLFKWGLSARYDSARAAGRQDYF